ncbi:hypothetical protein NX059_011543 [Plenodomus lindquistii]|nr:hypothetical protein NX059_011543 [Plenodomus lindquistii]
MPLVKLKDGTTDWADVCHAAAALWCASKSPDLNTLRAALEERYSDPAVTAVDLWTGINNSPRGEVVCTNDTIIIAFEGSHPDELIKNTWTDGKGSNLWDLPYAVFTDGDCVHSFYRDMWWGMMQATFKGLDDAVKSISARGAQPRKIMVAGFSMGGGVSILAFSDILDQIRKTYGSTSASPQTWAIDSNLGSLVQHFTFAAVAAADQGYYTVLNELYMRYQIRPWDFMNHLD